jgi:predicted RNA-binding Zn-ribbon protein involved in translation (DUF1610 family)
MILGGTHFDHLGEYDDVVAEDCKICRKQNKPIYLVEQGYFKLFGMALFPLSKKYFKTCSSCKVKLKVRTTDSNFRSVKAATPGGFKLKYVWGWIILIPIVIGVAIFLQSIKP